MFSDIIVDDIDILQLAIDQPIERGIPSGVNLIAGFENDPAYMKEFEEMFDIYLNKHLNFISSRVLKRRSNIEYFSYLFSNTKMPFVFERKCFEGFEYNGIDDYETPRLGLYITLIGFLKGEYSSVYAFRYIFDALIRSLYLRERGLILESGHQMRDIKFVEPWLSVWKFVTLVLKSITEAAAYINKNKIQMVVYPTDNDLILDLLCDIDPDFASIPINENVANRKEVFYLYSIRTNIELQKEKIKDIYEIYKPSLGPYKQIEKLQRSVLHTFGNYLRDAVTISDEVAEVYGEERLQVYNFILNILLRLSLDMLSFVSDISILDTLEVLLDPRAIEWPGIEALLFQIKRDIDYYLVQVIDPKNKGTIFRLCEKFVYEHVINLSYLFFKTKTIPSPFRIIRVVLKDIRYFYREKYRRHLYRESLFKNVQDLRQKIRHLKVNYDKTKKNTRLNIYDITDHTVIKSTIDPELWGIIVSRTKGVFHAPFITDKMYDIIKWFFISPFRLNYEQSIGGFMMEYIWQYCSYFKKRHFIKGALDIKLLNGNSLALGVCSFFQMLDNERLIYWRLQNPFILTIKMDREYVVEDPIVWLQRQMQTDGEENPFELYKIKSMFIEGTFIFTYAYMGFFNRVGITPFLKALHDDNDISKMLKMYISGYKGLSEQRVKRYIAETYRAKLYTMFQNGDRLAVNDTLRNDGDLLKTEIFVSSGNIETSMRLEDIIDVILSNLYYYILNETEQGGDEQQRQQETEIIEGHTNILENNILEFSTLGASLKSDKIEVYKKSEDKNYPWAFTPDPKSIEPLNEFSLSKGFINNIHLEQPFRKVQTRYYRKEGAPDFEKGYIMLCNVYPRINFRNEEALVKKVVYRSYLRFVTLSTIRARLQSRLRSIRKEIMDMSSKFLYIRESLFEKERNNYLYRTEIPQNNKNLRRDLPRYIEYNFEKWGLS